MGREYTVDLKGIDHSWLSFLTLGHCLVNYGSSVVEGPGRCGFGENTSGANLITNSYVLSKDER
jgi:hypothetical protein